MPRLSLSHLLLIPSISLSILSSLPSVNAYIPAQPVNDTSALNFTGSSTISISWTDPPSAYSGPVSYQLEADVATGGTTAGALVHFAESVMGPNLTTSTPWIAYISCDMNETDASEEWDIFTLARDRGAVSALLYTATSASCLLNEDYIQNFEKPLDVFATETVQVARIIDNQWTHTNASYYWYNGTLLNISGTDVNESLEDNAPLYRTYLIGTLTARNASGPAMGTGIPGPTSSAASSTKHGLPSSMIALYVITGIISFSFLLMLVTGARRAFRHPERYGRRTADDVQGPQSTAGGLAQAILDTFPVIRYNRSLGPGHHAGRARDEGHESDAYGGAQAKRISSEGNMRSLVSPELDYSHDQRAVSPSQGFVEPGYTIGRNSIALRSMHTDESASFHSAMDGGGPSSSRIGLALSESDSSSDLKSSYRSRSHSLMSPSGSRRTSRHDLQQQGLLELEQTIHEGRRVGAEQCPICLLDFEEGEDLRVLPCEGEHVYHQACIDPWLLEVSGSCPLCRKDFNNPNPTIEPIPTPSPTTPTHSQSQPPTHSGFAKYLAFMRRERRARRRPRADTGGTDEIGRGRRREADQTGPGGY